eukprot:427307_1
MQFVINLANRNWIYSHHKIVLQKDGFFTFIWTSRLMYSSWRIFYWSEGLTTHWFYVPEKPPSQSDIARKTVEKNDESAMELDNIVDILLKTLKRHWIKYFSSVKHMDYYDSYDFMAWTIMVSSARIQKDSILDANFGKVMFQLETSGVWF